MVINSAPEYVRKCWEASLMRLGVSYIELYYQHHVNISVPIEDTRKAPKRVGALYLTCQLLKVHFKLLCRLSVKKSNDQAAKQPAK